MTSVAFTGALQAGLIYALTAFGIYISFRILGSADLTVEGSFTLGACVCSLCVTNQNPVLGLILALVAGFLAGVFTGFLQTKCGIPPMLSGILTMTALYSVNLRVLGGRPNLSLLGVDTLFTLLQQKVGKVALTLIPLAVVAALITALTLFFKTQLGLSLRAVGDNEEMAGAFSINANLLRMLGLGLANGCVALGGALIAQYQGFAEVNMGIGIVVIGLASLVIGEIIPMRNSIGLTLLAVAAGSVLYRLIWAFVLARGFPTSDLRMVAALVVAVATAFPKAKETAFTAMQKRRGSHAHTV